MIEFHSTMPAGDSVGDRPRGSALTWTPCFKHGKIAIEGTPMIRRRSYRLQFLIVVPLIVFMPVLSGA